MVRLSAVAIEPRALAGPAWLHLTTAQMGVVTRAQAARCGVGRDLVARRVRSGTWQRIGSHVVVCHGGELSDEQKAWVAVLHAGEGAALFGLTALAADGLRGFALDVLEAVAPHGRGRRTLATDRVSVVVHESTRLGGDDVHPLHLPRRQRIARAAVDAAVCASTVDQARSILAAVVQQRLTTAERLRPYVLSRPTLPRHAILLETIADVEGGAQSLPELAWTRGIRRAGLPEPDRQRVVRRTDGRYFLGADFDEWETTVEINGAQHVDPVVRDYDDERRFELSAGGRLVIDIASHLVRHDLPRAVLRTARGLHCRGWQPSQPVAERLHRMADARGEPLWLPPLLGWSA